MKKAIFLDRDGTINSDEGHYYIYKVEDFVFNPGVIDGIRRLNEAGYLIIVVTNQGGVAKGEYTIEDVDNLHAHMCKELEKHGAPFRGYMKNLYYFDNVQAIFGEYIPSVASPDDIHGEIAVVSLGGDIKTVNDTGIRPASDGSDMLEMVMAEGDRIYCLYHRLSYDSSSGQMAWETTEPLEIRLNGNTEWSGDE